MVKAFFLFALFCLPVFFPNQVHAHAFGQLYNLPVPFWMYLYGGAIALVGSFLIIGYFFNKTNTDFKYPSIGFSHKLFFSVLTTTWFLNLLKISSILIFFLTIISGFVGKDNSRLNFNMTFFWVIFLLGFTYITALVGNVWAVVNPWKSLVAWSEHVGRRKVSGILKYPDNFGYYFAFIFYLFFIWLELFGKTSPFTLSVALLFYTIVNIVGAVLFGKEIWFTKCEFFSVFFKLVSKISIFEFKDKKLYLRPPLVGLLKNDADHFSLVVFIIFMLSSTAFDGVKSTLLGVTILGSIQSFLGTFLGQNSVFGIQVAGILGMLLSVLLFLSLYLLTLVMARYFSGIKMSIKKLSVSFAFSLIPIAFVYNVAHYYSLILTEGPQIIRLVSDPFGFKWDIFGTRAIKITPIIVNANVGWHTQVGLILLGHIAAVYLAHLVALRVFPSQKKALVSQLPMLILMVTYTMIGLWILAQPIVAEATIR